ncbi:MAG TPA: potassium channel protein [Pirellulales bacterium]|nr:potassium channel protein [Pirellulales bacterium]
MNSSARRVIIGGIFFGLTCVAAVVGYMAAGWHMLDAIYMVVITVFGVGYGEAKPLDNSVLKIFTMGVIIAGCSSGIYVVGGFVQMLAEGEINRVLGTRRMSKGIEQLEGHTLICGYGRVGQMLASDLAAAGQTFVVIDTSESRVGEAQAAGHLALLGSASEERTLEAAGIARAKVMAAVLPDDTANVFVTLTARDLNPSIQIIARAESPSTEKKLMRSGANRVVLPTLIGATKIAHMIVRPSAEDLLQETAGKTHLNEELKRIGLELTEIELKAASPLVGQKVGNVEVSGQGGFVVVAIKRADGTLVRAPQPDTLLAVGDIFMILGHEEALPEIARRAKPRAVMNYRGAKVQLPG